MVEEVVISRSDADPSDNCTCWCQCSRGVAETARDVPAKMAKKLNTCGCACPARGKNSTYKGALEDNRDSGSAAKVMQKIELVIGGTK